MIFHIITGFKLASFNGLPQAQVFLKHTKWPPIYRRDARTESENAFLQCARMCL